MISNEVAVEQIGIVEQRLTTVAMRRALISPGASRCGSIRATVAT